MESILEQNGNISCKICLENLIDYNHFLKHLRKHSTNLIEYMKNFYLDTSYKTCIVCFKKFQQKYFLKNGNFKLTEHTKWSICSKSCYNKSICYKINLLSKKGLVEFDSYNSEKYNLEEINTLFTLYKREKNTNEVNIKRKYSCLKNKGLINCNFTDITVEEINKLFSILMSQINKNVEVKEKIYNTFLYNNGIKVDEMTFETKKAYFYNILFDNKHNYDRKISRITNRFSDNIDVETILNLSIEDIEKLSSSAYTESIKISKKNKLNRNNIDTTNMSEEDINSIFKQIIRDSYKKKKNDNPEIWGISQLKWKYSHVKKEINKEFDISLSALIDQKYSEYISDRFFKNGLKDTTNNGWKKTKKGHFISSKNDCSIFYRSSLELKFCEYCEISDLITSYLFNPFGIKYKNIKNICAYYFPDVELKTMNNEYYLIEIKPQSALNLEINTLKFAAASGFVENSKKFKDFLIITEKELENTEKLNALFSR